MRIKMDRKIIVSIISLCLFTLVTIILFLGYTQGLDDYIHGLIIKIRNNDLTNIMLFITNICNVIPLLIITCIFVTCFKKEKITLYIILNLVNSVFLSQLFKFIVRRERPTDVNLIIEKGFSYPSGHSIVSMAFFGLLAYLIYKNYKNCILKYITISIILLLIILIGFSRVYLGVHYFSDVIGGYLISFAYLMLFVNLTGLNNPIKDVIK